MKRTAQTLILALLLSGCAKVSDITVINGTFGEDAPESILLEIDDMEISDLIDVENGSFSVEVPTNATALASLTYGMEVINFIPDGTSLSIDLSGDSPVITSDKPKISVQTRLDELNKKLEGIVAKLDLANEEEVERDFMDCCMDAIRDNGDNFVGLYALENTYYMLTLDQLEEALSYISDDLKDKDLISEIEKGLQSKRLTSVGEMFTDFTIIQDEDDPEGSSVKFSDYIGKGKYVLVDFWASWCGPCKKEIPNIKAVYEKYAGEKFNVLSVAVWDEPANTKAAAEALEITWDQIINAQQIPTDIYGIDGIPHIILFGPDGKILKRDLRGAGIEQEISKYVKAAH